MGLDSHAEYDGINIVHKRTAEAFLDYLRLSHDTWGSETRCTWVFRGHADSDWMLQPSAWRSDGRKVLEPLINGYKSQFSTLYGNKRNYGPHELDAIMEAAAQLRAVADFADVCDEIGKYIPTDYEKNIEEFIHQACGELDYRWRYKVGAAMAFAQHHGIPTALLDWTKDPLIAAYFAAQDPNLQSGIKFRGRKPKRLAVWALKQDELDTEQSHNDFSMKSVPVQRFNFEFLHAQDAFFLYYDGGLDYFRRIGIWPSLEEPILTSIASVIRAGMGKPLKKITLSRKHADELARLLYREKRSLAHLAPTYDNVCKTVTRKWSWEP